MSSDTTAGFPAPPLDDLVELQAPAHWRCIDFISDLHLSAETPRTFDAWADFLRHTEADAVFMLGDLFEVWIGDDVRHQAFEAKCAQLMLEVSRSRSLAFMAGNRDFLLGDEMLQASGVAHLSDPTLLIAFGQRVLLTHGDELCLADTSYQQFRALVRSASWQKGFLAKPIEERRQLARVIRDESEMRKLGKPSPVDWADVDANAAMAWLRAGHSPTMIHGHTHRPGSEAIVDGFTRHVLSDWDMDDEPHRAEVMRLTKNGFKRLKPEEATRSPK
jgi:UDP-2,3-diacylglucosamine hydrolase